MEGKRSLTTDEKRVLRALRESLSVFPMYDVFVHHRRDKGGRDRFAPILQDFLELVSKKWSMLRQTSGCGTVFIQRRIFIRIVPNMRRLCITDTHARLMRFPMTRLIGVADGAINLVFMSVEMKRMAASWTRKLCVFAQKPWAIIALRWSHQIIFGILANERSTAPWKPYACKIAERKPVGRRYAVLFTSISVIRSDTLFVC